MLLMNLKGPVCVSYEDPTTKQKTELEDNDRARVGEQSLALSRLYGANWLAAELAIQLCHSLGNQFLILFLSSILFLSYTTG